MTVDTWIQQAYTGKYKSVKKRSPLLITQYRKIENDIKKLANERKMKAYQCQAIIWLQFQTMKKGKQL